METNTQTTTTRDLPAWIKLEDMGPHLRRIYLAGRILTLGEVQQLPRNEGLPAGGDTVLGSLAPRSYREEPDDPARMPILEALVLTEDGLEVYVILDDTEDYTANTPEESRRATRPVIDAPRILLAGWTETPEERA